MKRVCVFCGANSGAKPAYAQAARDLAHAIAARGLGLVYGGSHLGLMGVLADSVLAAGGEVIGVMPGGLVAMEAAHRGLPDLRIVSSMHERKALMAELSDGFIALPGGYGTFDELCEALSWSQLRIHSKPCAVLNVEGYFDPLIAFFEHAVAERFLRPAHRAMLLQSEDPATLLDRMEEWRPPAVADKWIDRDRPAV